LLDTNLLLAVFQRKLDVLRELERLFEGDTYQLLVLEECLGELKKISAGVGEDARAAKSAQTYVNKLLESGSVQKVKGEKGDVDESIIDYAVRNGTTVATRDFKLRQVLRAKGVRVVTVHNDRLVLV